MASHLEQSNNSSMPIDVTEFLLMTLFFISSSILQVANEENWLHLLYLYGLRELGGLKPPSLGTPPIDLTLLVGPLALLRVSSHCFCFFHPLVVLFCRMCCIMNTMILEPDPMIWQYRTTLPVQDWWCVIVAKTHFLNLSLSSGLS